MAFGWITLASIATLVNAATRKQESGAGKKHLLEESY